jgi:hypothetical protein
MVGNDHVDTPRFLLKGMPILFCKVADGGTLAASVLGHHVIDGKKKNVHRRMAYQATMRLAPLFLLTLAGAATLSSATL